MNWKGWSVGWIDLSEATYRLGRFPTKALDQVKVPLTCKPWLMRLVPFICSES